MAFIMKQLETGFVFALTNPGSEKALKLEVEMARPDWRLSYQRRGFVTFKSSGDEPFSVESLDVPVACARRFCLSLGKSETRQQAVEKIVEALGAGAIVQQARYFERKMQGVQDGGDLPEIGDWVGTVVELSENEFWSGVHRHDRFLSAYPAGDPGLVMPAESPSRAWLKVEEAVRFFGIEFSEKDIVVEVGASPGGVVLALLNRGASVIGVDPAKMAEVVMASAIENREDARRDRPWFYHCRKPAALVSKRDLGTGVTWFMSDMNQSPEVVLKECARFRKMCPSIRGALMTLKLMDLLDVGRKDEWFSALREMGFRTIRMQQFSAHHKEVVLMGEVS